MTAKQPTNPSQAMKLGAKPSRPDGRIPHINSVVELAEIFLPDKYDFDSVHPGIQMNVFGNDQYGDCVIAARANHTLRISYTPGMQISTDEVVNEYKTENAIENDGVFVDKNGLDLGLSLARWQLIGWVAAGVADRKIQSYYRVSWQDSVQVKSILYSKVGLQIRLSLPDGLNEFGRYGPDHPWNSINAQGGDGHAILLTGYDHSGPIGITWGTKQNLSWDFLRAYCTDAYAVVPDLATFNLMKDVLSKRVPKLE